MYTPTKTELEELRFEKNSLGCYVLYEDETKDIALLYYNHPDDMYSGYRPSFHIDNISFYPRSLDHLKSILLAFNPTE